MTNLLEYFLRDSVKNSYSYEYLPTLTRVNESIRNDTRLRVFIIMFINCKNKISHERKCMENLKEKWKNCVSKEGHIKSEFDRCLVSFFSLVKL